MYQKFSRFTCLLMFIQVFALQMALADDVKDRNAIRVELEQLVTSGVPSNSDVSIASVNLLLEIYEKRDYLPAWNDQRQIGELLTAIKATAADGLDPSDYHLKQVEFIYSDLVAGRQVSPSNSPAKRAVQDIILTDSLARLGYHQLFGKVNPYTFDPHWNFRRELNDIDPATALQSAIDSPSLTDFLNNFFERGWFYRKLQVALADYRQIAANGGWSAIPEGPTLRPGDSDRRLPVLARRLIISGDLGPRAALGKLTIYDESLQKGVRRFQERHALDTDAVIGPATLRALNVPVEKRVEQLEINIERARWVLDDIEDDFVLVNIAGFRAYVLRDRKVVWKTKVQVGSTFHQSPVFRDEIKFVVINPTWTVPFSIATREILPKIKRDPNYFANRDFDLKDNNGKIIDPASVNWAKITERNFPFWLVQRPGPNNALGRVKVMFPNEHAVYLHDTPSKALFSKAERAFSHGCIRVENPFDFAEQLLGGDGWNQEKFQQVLDEGKIKTVLLSKPIPVLLLYWTAMVDPDGVVYFYNDVYERDARIAEALNQPFRLDMPTQ
jgi:murein L,D-transpeptidase YcbB/YkuD